MTDIAIVKSMERQFVVLGSMIMDPGCLQKGLQCLQERFFLSPKALAIWRGINACVAAGQAVDMVAVAGAAKDIRLTDIAAATEQATVAGFAFYLDTLIQEANRKECAAQLMDSVRRLLHEDAAPQDEARRCSEMFGGLARGADTGTCRTIDEAVQDKIDHIKAHGYDDVYEFGLNELDRITGGIASGTFSVIAARPGVGKSTFAVNLAYQMHLRGYWTGYLSMEMGNFSLAQCMMKLKNKIAMGKQVRLEELEKLKPTIKDIKMAVDHGCAGLTPSMLASKVRELKRKHDVKMVFVDYLQLMEDDEKHKSRYEMVTRISNRIMNFSHSSGVAIVALAQINRESDKLKDAREPKLSDLRDSGAIEQDADLCMLLHSKSFDEDEPDTRNITLNVAKNRAGSVGRVSFLFDASRARFWEMGK